MTTTHTTIALAKQPPNIDTALVQLHPSRSQILSELIADLRALTVGSEPYPASNRVQFRPELLGRVALLLAADIPPETSKLIGATADAPLVTATALHAGVPFALCNPDGSIQGGSLTDGDSIIAVVYTTHQGTEISAKLAEADISVDCTLAVFTVGNDLKNADSHVHALLAGSDLNQRNVGVPA